MMRPAPVAVGVVLAATILSSGLGAAQAPAAQEQAPVFRAGADVVSVEASVRRDRRAVTGLKSTDFELLDNGVVQEISDVSYEKLPIDVTVLLDTSASVVGSALDRLRAALRQLRSDLGAPVSHVARLDGLVGSRCHDSTRGDHPWFGVAQGSRPVDGDAPGRAARR